MPTLLTRDPSDAVAVLEGGGTCAFPTETVYGLGALARDAEAVEAVFQAKGRPGDNPLIVHVADLEAVEGVATMTEMGRRLLEAFAPGPLTVVLPARSGLAPTVTAGLDTVAVRVPSGIALEIVRGVGAPVVAPSANRSGRPSPTTWQAVLEDLDGRIDAIMQGPPTAIGIESTVVDASSRTPVVLRPGSVTLAQIRDVCPDARNADHGDGTIRSPGTRHRHYAPRATVTVVDLEDAQPGSDAAWIGVSEPPDGYGLATVCADLEDYARRLYDAFRRADAHELTRIEVERVEGDGIEAALSDRLRRAAAR
ncbi:L-threonylcarbamoyladenylate synthase [Rubrivirga sp.]|uniref:L-threonylcarbamoyladenylate synthase n=1 Tax=Rubrivirga sp. TaxID=1885344 RepID=UPI003C7362A7